MKKFSKELEQKIIDLYLNDNYTKVKIAEICNLKRDQVDYILQKNKINRVSKREEIFKVLVDEYLTTDCSYTDLAKKYNIPDHKIEYYFASRGIKRDYKKYIENVFSNKTENSAYWIGFIAADGSLSDKRHSIEIGIQIEDINHLKKFSKFITYEDNLRIGIREKTKSCRITVINQKIYSDVKKYNLMPNKSFKIRFDDIISNFNNDSELIRHFIRGYFDGDGSLSYDTGKLKNLRVGFCGNEEFLLQLQEYLSNLLNIETNMYSKKGTNIKQLNIRYKIDAIKFLKYIYEKSNIYLDRKYNKYAVLVGNN